MLIHLLTPYIHSTTQVPNAQQVVSCTTRRAHFGQLLTLCSPSLPHRRPTLRMSDDPSGWSLTESDPQVFTQLLRDLGVKGLQVVSERDQAGAGGVKEYVA